MEEFGKVYLIEFSVELAEPDLLMILCKWYNKILMI